MSELELFRLVSDSSLQFGMVQCAQVALSDQVRCFRPLSRIFDGFICFQMVPSNVRHFRRVWAGCKICQTVLADALDDSVRFQKCYSRVIHNLFRERFCHLLAFFLVLSTQVIN